MKLRCMLSKIFSFSYGIQHIIKQCNTIITEPSWSSKRRKIYNLGFDVLLGGLLYCTLTRYFHSANISDDVMDFARLLKESLDELLQWLMGAPAGLKLNHELSYFLGNFFLYHVEIWMTYLQVIRTYLPTVVSVVACSNWLGISMFLSLLNDVVNGLTFHMSCFYVYAANLYRVQLEALISLARLFRGKKWNVLRLRVDSVNYKADQLILGTILFTILLFLLPTTLLYYAVFATIRVAVLFIQTLLMLAVDALTSFDLHDVIKREGSKGKPLDKADTLEVIETKHDSDLKKADVTNHESDSQSQGLKNLVGCLLKGVIIQTP